MRYWYDTEGNISFCLLKSYYYTNDLASRFKLSHKEEDILVVIIIQGAFNRTNDDLDDEHLV